MSDHLHTVVSGSSAQRQWLVAAAWAGLAVAGTAFAQSVTLAPEDPVAMPPGNAAGNPATASATDAYTSFRTEFDAGRYAEAVPHAERVLELAAAQATTPTAEEVQVALMNLGMVQNLSDDYVGAESTYLRAIKLVESSGRPLHDRLARAYAGLASAYHDGNRHDLAVQSFDQAIALKRRHEGLLTAQQVPLVEKYIDSLTELGRYPEALKAQKYLLRIATRQYGATSPQLADPGRDRALVHEHRSLRPVEANPAAGDRDRGSRRRAELAAPRGLIAGDRLLQSQAIARSGGAAAGVPRRTTRGSFS